MSNGGIIPADYIEALRATKREGIEKLITWLNQETDFFTAPASTKFHGAYPLGLMEHSITVCKELTALSKRYCPNSPPESVLIVSLLHDLCKANFYKIGYRNKKDEVTGRWEKVEVYEVEDKQPFGHGEKSVILAQRFIQLSDEEIAAIRWHMGGYDDSARGGFSSGSAISAAYEKYPLAVALHMADLAASFIQKK